MAKALSQQDVHQLALVGARAKLDGLQAEVKSLLAAFPELGGGAARRGPGRRKAAAPAAKAAGRQKKRRYNMTAEQKQAVSDRMKKYWASRRKEKSR